ncbi:MAG: 4-hydroxy-tetrahydrodipicolinate synthase [Phycisphaeraceae bacterium]|nr:4-hydroxy-tetrahydrodipicolinate synthase [Phycisphaeraceae bacterium]
MKLQGAFTAMVTPFTADGEVDWQQLVKNVNFQIEGGIDGLVPCGTTGESPTLNNDEHSRVIEEVTKASAGRVPVIAGTGSNSTTEAIELTKHAKEAGVDCVLSVNPYYNKPTQEGMYRHFMKIADVGVPVMLYNIPGRSGVALTCETVYRLSQHPNIVAIKEATGSLDTASEIAMTCGEDFTILSGDDAMSLPLMSIGGKGVISVISNLLPAKIKALTEAGLSGDFVKARELHLDLFKLCKGMLSIETNPIPIKTAMMFAGMDTGLLRLPMCEMGEDNKAILKALLEDCGAL